MFRRLVAAISVLGLACVLTVQADTAKSGKKTDDQKNKFDSTGVAKEQERLKNDFLVFKQELMRLVQSLEQSGKPANKEKARILRGAIERAAASGVDAKFSKLVSMLRSEKIQKDLNAIEEAELVSKELRSDLRLLLKILMTDNRSAQLRKEIEETKRLLESIKNLIRKQERVRANMERPNTDARDVKKDQTKVTDATGRLIGKGKGTKGKEAKGSSGKGKGAGKEGKKGSAEGRTDTGKSKSDKKEEGKGEGSKGEKGSEGKKGEGKGSEGSKGQKSEGKGSKGSEGSKGSKGKGSEGKGSKGSQGSKGKGSKGSEGSKGSKGKGSEGKGSKGSKGGQGSKSEGKGKPGDKGSKGEEGSKGKGSKPDDKGAKPGDKGSKGKGSKGSEGSKGSKGSKGSQGKGQSAGKGQSKGSGKGGKGSEGSKGSKGGEGSPSSGKGGGKGGQGGKGKGGKGGKGGGGQQQPPQDQKDQNPVKKQIADANESQKQAENELDKDQKDEASDKASDAIKKLEEAKKKLEELLKQLREEEIERLLTALINRCQKMLRLQIQVRDGTVDRFNIQQKRPDKKLTRADQQEVAQLAIIEDAIVKEADAALSLIEAEGTAVAFAEVFKQVRSDMVSVSDRLRAQDVAKLTQTIENQIIDTLKEMIKALEKAKKDNKSGKPKPGKPGQQGQPGDQKLIDILAELKMIRSMQVRLNTRTKVYGEFYPSLEQAPEPNQFKDKKKQAEMKMVWKELIKLSDRQDNIARITRDIATGKNQ